MLSKAQNNKLDKFKYEFNFQKNEENSTFEYVFFFSPTLETNYIRGKNTKQKVLKAKTYDTLKKMVDIYIKEL